MPAARLGCVAVDAFPRGPGVHTSADGLARVSKLLRRPNHGHASATTHPGGQDRIIIEALVYIVTTTFNIVHIIEMFFFL